MAERRKVIIVNDWYLPATKAGGPVRSIAAIVSLLNEWFDFSVITSDRDIGDGVPFTGLELNQWTNAPDGTRTFYCSSDVHLKRKFIELFEADKPSIVYVNGIFSAYCRLAIQVAQRMGITTIVAPRGMLGAGALQIKSLKKKIFLQYARVSGKFGSVKWHASSEQEKEEVLSVFSGANVHVAMNLALKISVSEISKTKIKGQVDLVFLSRISEKKNLLGALQMLHDLNPAAQANLKIYGPVEDAAYWSECQLAIAQLPAHITTEYKGDLAHDEVSFAFQQSNLFLFPTHHENFGHVILEALQVGTPVLISDQTPWKNLAEHKAGWDLPLNDPKAFATIIDRVAAMDENEFAEWRRGAMEFAARYANDEKLVELNRNLFS